MPLKSAHRSGEVAGIDGVAVSEWIAANVAGVGAPLRFTAVGNGRSNLTYLAEDPDGGAVIVRRPPLGVDGAARPRGTRRPMTKEPPA